MKNLYTLLIFTLAVIVFSACEKGTVYNAKSYIRYMDAEKVTNVEIQFFDENEKKIGKEVANVFFNDGVMEKRSNSVQGILYRAERDGDYSGAFTFKIKEGKAEKTVEVKAVGLAGFMVKDRVANKRSGMTLQWKTEALIDNETLDVVLIDAENTTAELTVASGKNGMEAFVPGTIFSGLKSGKGNIFVVKRKMESIKTKNITLNSVVDYHSPTLEVLIIE